MHRRTRGRGGTDRKECSSDAENWEVRRPSRAGCGMGDVGRLVYPFAAAMAQGTDSHPRSQIITFGYCARRQIAGSKWAWTPARGCAGIKQVQRQRSGTVAAASRTSIVPGKRRPIGWPFLEKGVPTLNRLVGAIGQTGSFPGEQLLAD